MKRQSTPSVWGHFSDDSEEEHQVWKESRTMRPSSPSSTNREKPFKVFPGAKVEVFFQGLNLWVRGKVIETIDDQGLCRFISDEDNFSKWVKMNDRSLVRRIKPSKFQGKNKSKQPLLPIQEQLSFDAAKRADALERFKKFASESIKLGHDRDQDDSVDSDEDLWGRSSIVSTPVTPLSDEKDLKSESPEKRQKSGGKLMWSSNKDDEKGPTPDVVSSVRALRRTHKRIPSQPPPPNVELELSELAGKRKSNFIKPPPSMTPEEKKDKSVAENEGGKQSVTNQDKEKKKKDGLKYFQALVRGHICRVNISRKSDICTWTPFEVSDWLFQIPNLSKYAKQFLQSNVTGKQLSRILTKDSDDTLDLMYVNPVEDRKQLVAALRRLKIQQQEKVFRVLCHVKHTKYRWENAVLIQKLWRGAIQRSRLSNANALLFRIRVTAMKPRSGTNDNEGGSNLTNSDLTDSAMLKRNQKKKTETQNQTMQSYMKKAIKLEMRAEIDVDWSRRPWKNHKKGVAISSPRNQNVLEVKLHSVKGVDSLLSNDKVFCNDEDRRKLLLRWMCEELLKTNVLTHNNVNESQHVLTPFEETLQHAAQLERKMRQKVVSLHEERDRDRMQLRKVLVEKESQLRLLHSKNVKKVKRLEKMLFYVQNQMMSSENFLQPRTIAVRCRICKEIFAATTFSHQVQCIFCGYRFDLNIEKRRVEAKREMVHREFKRLREIFETLHYDKFSSFVNFSDPLFHHRKNIRKEAEEKIQKKFDAKKWKTGMDVHVYFREKERWLPGTIQSIHVETNSCQFISNRGKKRWVRLNDSSTIRPIQSEEEAQAHVAILNASKDDHETDQIMNKIKQSLKQTSLHELFRNTNRFITEDTASGGKYCSDRLRHKRNLGAVLATLPCKERNRKNLLQHRSKSALIGLQLLAEQFKQETNETVKKSLQILEKKSRPFVKRHKLLLQKTQDTGSIEEKEQEVLLHAEALMEV
eukprot:g2825.t1